MWNSREQYWTNQAFNQSLTDTGRAFSSFTISLRGAFMQLSENYLYLEHCVHLTTSRNSYENIFLPTAPRTRTSALPIHRRTNPVHCVIKVTDVHCPCHQMHHVVFHSALQSEASDYPLFSPTLQNPLLSHSTLQPNVSSRPSKVLFTRHCRH